MLIYSNYIFILFFVFLSCTSDKKTQLNTNTLKVIDSTFDNSNDLISTKLIYGDTMILTTYNNFIKACEAIYIKNKEIEFTCFDSLGNITYEE